MEYRFDIANQVLIFVVLSLSLNLLIGYAGQVSLAHAAIAGIGGYAAAKLAIANGMDFVPSLVLATLMAAAAGAFLSVPALRLTVQHLILLTLAAAVVLVTIANSTRDLGGAYGLVGMPVPSIFGKSLAKPSQFFWFLLCVSAICALLYWRLADSPYGRVLRALREDELAARAVGKNVFVYKVQVFALASAMAGLMGALWAYYLRLASPVQFNVTQSLLLVTMVIFGGMGSLLGPVVGAALIVVSSPILEKNLDIGAEKAALIRLVIYGAALVVLMRLRPEGLIPEHFSFRRALARLGLPLPGAGAAAGQQSPPPAAGAADPAAPAGPGQPDAGIDIAARTPVVTVEGLRKAFGGIVAVDGVDLALRERVVTGLVGPNGAGKTTLFNLLTGVIPPDGGTIRLKGKDITGMTPDAIARLGMARSFQDVRLFLRMTVLENVMLAYSRHPGEHLPLLLGAPLATSRAERRARELALECLSFVGLVDKAGMLAGGLSFGEQKLVAIARLLATGADVLLLDEPISGVDPQWVDRVALVIRALPAQGKTVCVVEHNLYALGQLADHCYFMESGRITAEGSLQELMADPRLIAAYFGA
ncbi:Arginine transport ATP-binding protein ArtM [bacterium HR24]|jgi:branched-chain amino acid transport system permease protein|nr:Arginine transport ATP-binding protein ArtM [bacterium HR24]